MRRKTYKTEDYILLGIPENEWLFAVQRSAEGKECFVKRDPEGRDPGRVYTGLTYIVSPFMNYETGGSGESCTCLSWRTRHTRCIHLKKFFEMNPERELPDIYKETSLKPDELAAVACAELQTRFRPEVLAPLVAAIKTRLEENYRDDPTFRKQVAACRKNAEDAEDALETIEWLQAKMAAWAKTARI